MELPGIATALGVHAVRAFPQLTFLDLALCQTVFQASLEICRGKGTPVRHKRARQLPVATCACIAGSELVHLGTRLVEWALWHAPREWRFRNSR